MCQAKSEVEMAPREKVKDKVLGLVKTLGMTQAQVGKRARISQSKMSDYCAGNLTPSPAMFVRLAMIAPYPDNLWFLGQAGVDEKLVQGIAENLFLERRAPAVEGEIIRVPRISDASKQDGVHSPLLALPSCALGGYTSLRYTVLDEAVRLGGIQEGDIIVLDTSADITRNLAALWGKKVLARIYSSSDSGFYEGSLTCIADTDFRGSQASLKDWIAFLAYTLNLHAELSEPDLGVALGEMRLTRKDWDRIGAPQSRGELSAKQPEIEKMPVRLFDGTEILGAVVGHFHPLARA